MRCEVCTTESSGIYRRCQSGLKTFWLCHAHADQQYTDQPLVDDPRPLIMNYQREGVIVKDIGLALVEGYEAQGPAFVTELRTIQGAFQLVCVSPKEALNRTATAFIIFRCRAILHGIRTMLGINSPVPT